MLPKIKLVISENNKVIESISKETKTQPSHLVKSLQEFQREANAAITKMIEKNHEDVGKYTNSGIVYICRRNLDKMIHKNKEDFYEIVIRIRNLPEDLRSDNLVAYLWDNLWS